MNNSERLEAMGYKYDFPTRQMVLPAYYEADFRYEVDKLRTADIATAPNYPTVIQAKDVDRMTDKDFEKLSLVLV